MEPILDMFLNECMSENKANYIRSGLRLLVEKHEVDVLDRFLDYAYQRDNRDPSALAEQMMVEMDHCLLATMELFGIYYGDSFDRASLLLLTTALLHLDESEYDESAVKMLRKVYDEEQAHDVFTDFAEHITGRIAQCWAEDIDRVQISTITRIREIFEDIQKRTEHRQDELLSMISDGAQVTTINKEVASTEESTDWRKYVHMCRTGFLATQGVNAGDAVSMIETLAIGIDYPTGLKFDINCRAIGKYINMSPNVFSVAVFYMYVAMISAEWNEKGFQLLDNVNLLEGVNMEEESPELRLAIFKAATKTILQHFDNYKARYEKA